MWKTELLLVALLNSGEMRSKEQGHIGRNEESVRCVSVLLCELELFSLELFPVKYQKFP